VRSHPVRVRIVGIRGLRPKVDAIDGGDAVALDDASALSGSFWRNSLDEHAQCVAARARGAELDAKRSALRHRRVHSQENPIAEGRIAQRPGAEHATFQAAVRVFRAARVGLCLGTLSVQRRRHGCGCYDGKKQ